jgi:sialidase-1
VSLFWAAMKLLLLLAAALSLASRVAAAENDVVLNIEPSKEYPRNSEGSFARLQSGKIIFYYTQFYGGTGDEAPAHIVGIESADGGRTWSGPREIVPNRGGKNVMSVSLLRLQSGKLALFYVLKNSWTDCRPYVSLSTDEAATWSEPRLAVAAPGYFVLNNDRVIQLASGRLVVPVAFHRSRDTDPHSSRSFDSRALAFWYLSDDEGQSWTESATWWALPGVRTGTGMQEPGVIELQRDHLFTWARTDQGRQFGCTSTDGGRTWTAPAPTELQSPVSPASMKHLPNSNQLLAIYNDHSGQFPFPKGRRTPLIAAVSSDGGASWPKRKVLEPDPDGWYCYTAIHFTEDAVLLGYCAGDKVVGGLNRLRIRRIALDWLTAP